jgi:WD40 repeat protein
VQKLALLATCAVMLLLLSNSAGRAQTTADLKPVAVLKGKTEPVTGIALSADGSRLVVTAERVGTVWAVNEERQICTLGPAADVPANKSSGSALARPLLESAEAANPTPKPRMVYPLLSRDGTVVAAGSISGAGRVQVFQAWDAASGAAIGPAVSTPALGSFTAAALSGDGRLLAVAENERTLEVGEPVPLNPSGVGMVSVWDLNAGKLKWRLPATRFEDDAATSDDNVYSLAFSPDLTRLAVSCRAPGGRRLKILRLENGVATPRVERPDRLAGVPSHGEVLWRPRDGRLLFRDGFDFEIWDSTRLTREAEFTLASTPRPPAGEDGGGGGGGAADFHNAASALGGSGTRLVVLRQRLVPERRLRQLRVVVFDLALRKPIGFLALPNQDYEPGRVIQAQPISGGFRILATNDKVSGVPLALSGDGNRLAVASGKGTVSVYDVAQLVDNARRVAEERRRPGDRGGDEPRRPRRP